MTHPHCGTSFSLARVCLYLHAKLVQNAAQKLLTLVWHFAAFFTHVRAHKWRGWGQLPLSHGGVEGDLPPFAGQLFSLCSSICACKTGRNCSEMLLPANSVWNFVAFAHLRYLKIVLRFCVEGHAWVRVGVSRAVKASL